MSDQDGNRSVEVSSKQSFEVYLYLSFHLFYMNFVLSSHCQYCSQVSVYSITTPVDLVFDSDRASFAASLLDTGGTELVADLDMSEAELDFDVGCIDQVFAEHIGLARPSRIERDMGGMMCSDVHLKVTQMRGSVESWSQYRHGPNSQDSQLAIRQAKSEGSAQTIEAGEEFRVRIRQD